MLTLERKGFWLWGDRLLFPILMVMVWALCLPWLLGEYGSGGLLTGSAMSATGAWVSFKTIPHIRTISVDEKNLTVTFVSGQIRRIPKKAVEQLGAGLINDQGKKGHGLGYAIAYRDETRLSTLRISHGQSIHGKPCSYQEAVAQLAKELGLRKIDIKGTLWPRWTRES